MMNGVIENRKELQQSLEVIIMKGISCSGKSTVAKKISKERNAIILSSDEINKEFNNSFTQNSKEVFAELTKKAKELLSKGQSVIIDTTSCSNSKTSKWVFLAKEYKAKKVCVFVNPSENQLQKNKSLRVSEETPELLIDLIILSQKKALYSPHLLNDFDEIILIQEDNKMEEEAKVYFKENISSKILTDFKIVDHKDYFKKHIPDLFNTIDFDQENIHHEFLLHEHIQQTINHLKKYEDEDLLLAALFHDIGKSVDGCKRLRVKIKENGYSLDQEKKIFASRHSDGEIYIGNQHIPKEFIEEPINHTYYDHEKISARLTYRILEALGYNKERIVTVGSIILFHMALDYDFIRQCIEIESRVDSANKFEFLTEVKKIKGYKKYKNGLKDLFYDVIVFSMADYKAKGNVK